LFTIFTHLKHIYVAFEIILCVKDMGGKASWKRPRRRWVDNIKMDLTEIGWDGMDWIDLVQGRDKWRALVNTVMYLWVP
jgi:hypothetical protein